MYKVERVLDECLRQMFTRGKPYGGAHGIQHPKFLRIVWGAPCENKNLLHSLVEKHLQTGNHRATAFFPLTGKQ